MKRIRAAHCLTDGGFRNAATIDGPPCEVNYPSLYLPSMRPHFSIVSECIGDYVLSDLGTIKAGEPKYSSSMSTEPAKIDLPEHGFH